MAILITGGAGYIGSHTAIELMKAGYSIAILDNFSNSKTEALARVKEITGQDFPMYDVDLLDVDSVRNLFIQQPIEAVIHFAGLKAVGESVKEPMRYYYNNLVGTLHLCQVMKEFNVKRLVFSSSATVYGMSDVVPLTEDLPIAAINPYGRTKVMIEQMLQDMALSDPEWSIALLRYFNPVGAHPSGRIGEDPNGIPNNLVPYITQVAVGKLKELPLYGTDYPTPDGTCIRDYIHVLDLAFGHVKALAYVLDHRGVEAFNLGTGQGSSVLEVIRAFEEASGISIQYRVTDRRAGDAPISYADVSKAQKVLGWKADRSLVEMCRDAWRWQSSNPNGYEEPS